MSKREPESFDDEALLKEIRESRIEMEDASRKMREQEDLDMKALSVEGPWPEAELTARRNTDNPRPHGHTDIISQYNNRVVNQARMNKSGVKINPKGEAASKETAEKREARMREIAYDSKASSAELSALQNAVDCGRGYWRVDTEYVSAKSRNLKIVVKRIRNPKSVLDDPDCMEADRSDRKKLIYLGNRYTEAEFKRRFPHAKDIKGFSPELLSQGRSWYDGKRILVAEYWKVLCTPVKVLFFAGQPEGVFEDELPEGVKVDGDMLAMADGRTVPIEDTRMSERKEVKKYFTNGFEILDKEDWLGSWIPFPCTYGREKYEGDELVVESMTRKAREPQLNFDVARANEMESLNRVSKADFMVSDEAIEGYEDMWKMLHRNPMAYVKWRQRNAEGLPNEKPEHFIYEPPIQGVEVAANSFIRDAQNAVGMASVERIDRVAKSGIAQAKVEESGDVSNFHFTDNFAMGLEFEWRIINELLDKIEDSERTVGMRSPDGKYSMEKIAPQQMPDGSVKSPYGAGDDHGVTISKGPDYQSQRDEASAFADTLAADPNIFAILGPLIVNLKNLGPIGDKMEKVLKATLPPQVAAAYEDDKEGKPPLPPEVTQGIEKMSEQLKSVDAYAKDAEKKIIELQDKLEGQVVANASKEKIAEADNTTKIELQRMKDEVELKKLALDIQMKQLDLEIARMNARTSMFNKTEELSSKEDVATHQTEHAETEAERSRQHTSEEADKGRKHEAENAKDKE